MEKMNNTGPVSPGGLALLRSAGLLTWALAGLPFLVTLPGRPALALDPKHLLWLLSYGIFGIAFWLTSWRGQPGRASTRHVWLLVVQTVAALLMIRFVCSGHEGALLAIVAGQLGWFLPLRRALPWATAQAALMAFIIAAASPAPITIRLMVTYLGFQALTLFACFFAASEARAREHLARINAELRATQTLLASSSRIAERERISRELHDVLGHHLTALSLNLEVAGHLSGEPARGHVRQAHALAKQMLGDVRGVVTTLRQAEPIDLTAALQALVGSITTPRIHLEIPPDLDIRDPMRAHTLVRCVQEIITNTVRHARASTLWISLVRTDGGIEVRARDDGRGAPELKPGYGLLGMRERLEEVGGRLEIAAGPHTGFEIKASMPLPRTAA